MQRRAVIVTGRAERISAPRRWEGYRGCGAIVTDRTRARATGRIPATRAEIRSPFRRHSGCWSNCRYLREST